MREPISRPFCLKSIIDVITLQQLNTRTFSISLLISSWTETSQVWRKCIPPPQRANHNLPNRNRFWPIAIRLRTIVPLFLYSHNNKVNTIKECVNYVWRLFARLASLYSHGSVRPSRERFNFPLNGTRAIESAHSIVDKTWALNKRWQLVLTSAHVKDWASALMGILLHDNNINCNCNINHYNYCQYWVTLLEFQSLIVTIIVGNSWWEE